MIIWPVLGSCEIKRLMRSKQRGIVPFFDIHLRCLNIELVNAGGILVLIPVNKEFGVTLVAQLKALEPSRVADNQA